MLAGFILILVLILFYSDVVLGGRSFLMGPITTGVTPTGPYTYDHTEHVDRFVGDPGAIAWAMEPWSFTINRMFKAGDLPLWNPHQGMGTPFLGSAQPAPFDPLLLIVHLAPESWWPVAVDVHLLLRYFLAGFFTYLFLRAIGVGFSGGIAAAITFMLCGYLVFYGNIAFVRADALLPMLVFSYDRLAVNPTRRTFLFSIAALWLIIATGFPETLPLHVGLAGVWYLFRIGQRLRAGNGVRVAAWQAARLAASGVFAALLAAFILGPFIETVIHAEHIHYAGSMDREMTYSGDFVSTLVSVFLPVESNIFTIPNIFPLGVLPLTLAFYAAIHALQHVRKARRFTWPTLYFFVIGFALVVVAFRGPLLDFVPDLPGISSIIMWKYPQVLIAFCVAVCVGTGVQFWLYDRNRLSNLLVAILVFVTILLLLFSKEMDARRAVESLAPTGQVVLLLTTLLGLAVVYRYLPKRGLVLVWGIALLLLVEPLLWFGSIDRSVRTFPYDPPPYIDLMNQSGQAYRVFGIDDQFFPNVASAFGVDDIRYVDALHPQEYLDFARAHVTTSGMRRRFLGTEQTIQFSRGINFLNVGYVVTTGPGGQFARHLAGIRLDDEYDTVDLTIGDRTERVLDAGNRTSIEARVVIPPGQHSILDVTFGVDPSIWECACALENGITYAVYLRDDNDIRPLMERFVDPVNNPEDRRWFTERIELGEWASERRTLLFVRQAPEGSTGLEYARWAIPTRLSAGYAFPWLEDAAAETQSLSISRWLSLPVYSLTIDGDTRFAVRQHPPSRANLLLGLPDGETQLTFGIGLDPELWSGQIDPNLLGDGVNFRVALGVNGETQTLFEQYIDPKNNPDERRWQDIAIDLSPWSGQRVDLRFSTDAGPLDDATYDWAFWSDIQVSGDDVEPALAYVSDLRQFTPIYSEDGLVVYRNELVFPRAYVVRNVILADNTADAVDRFGDPDFNPTNAVILTGPLDAATLDKLNALPTNLLADTVDITSQRANTMTLEADLNAPGVLVTSELDYPGWHARVDGQEVDIIQANGVARALYLDAGQHVLEFYYHPLPFWIGLWVSLAALVVLVGVLLVWRRVAPTAPDAADVDQSATMASGETGGGGTL